MMKIVSVLVAAFTIALGVKFLLVDKMDAPAPHSDATPTLAAVTPDPNTTTVSYSRAATISRRSDGHYWTRADVDGRAVEFMVDTGASIVALTPNDAKRLGLELKPEDFKWKINTAGGQIMGAYTTLEEIRIGKVTVKQVDAMVMPEGLENSLLGMSFLNELYSFEFRGDQMIIRQ